MIRQIIRKAITVFTSVILCCLFSNAYAQEFKVSGTVTDSYGDPLPGVGVIEKDTTNGVVTDLDGKYTILVGSGSASLEFSCMGMKTETITVSNRTILNVTLNEDAIGLQEVITIGYGSMKREEIDRKSVV